MIVDTNGRFSDTGGPKEPGRFRFGRIFPIRAGIPILAAVLIISGILLRCGHPGAMPQEVKKKYEADAHRLCNAITDCIKEDVARRLSGSPRRKAMVLQRMTHDLCLKGQYRLIGDLSVDPDPNKKPAPYDPEIYRLYSECSRAVARARDCQQRRELHRNHPACRALREAFGDN